MKIIPCDYWQREEGCSFCPAAYCNCCPKPIEKEELIQKLEKAKENIQKMLDKLRES